MMLTITVFPYIRVLRKYFPLKIDYIFMNPNLVFNKIIVGKVSALRTIFVHRIGGMYLYILGAKT